MKRLLAGVLLLGLAACGEGSSTSPTETISFTETTVGTGATAVAGDTVTVHYVLTLTNGTLVQSSVAVGTPFTFRLGVGQVIPGFDQGVTGMRIGGKRRVTIPPSLGYGNQPPANSGIPSNATLIFDIDLLAIAGKS